MKILKETKDGNHYIWEIEYTTEEYNIFKTYVEAKKHPVDQMTNNEIVQIAIEGILEETIKKEKEKEERKENEQK